MSDDALHDLPEPIAIIGLAGRFPGARNLDQFWQNVRDGVESVTLFSDEELLAAGVEPRFLRDPAYVRSGAILDDIDQFDARFFGFSPREAELIDPQQRLFLECAWEALEHAGYDPETYAGAIGVYAGVSLSTYLGKLYANRALMTSADGYHIGIGNDKDHLPTRASYKLNLKGPSVSIQTACSTSLVAVHFACQNLLTYQCDMALAGGVSIRVPQTTGYLYQEGGITSPDGHCRSFDAEARGTFSGYGVGIVVLKRLSDALADGDTIHALIRGSAVNNDGASKVGYTAPSVDGQMQVIATAQSMAGVGAATIDYVEAHGTATSLGDPIEVAALTKAFRLSTDKKGFCALGSVKTNIGHLDAAAGVAGLIKTVLALKHRQIPPSLHFHAPNPQIDFATSPFFVNAQLAEWQANGHPRRAGVSSFGIGGTNAHVILEEAPPAEAATAGRAWQLLTLSARTPSALAAQSSNLAAYLQHQRNLSLADVAYTLAVGRQDFSQRRVIVAQHVDDAIAALTDQDSRRSWNATAPEDRSGRAVVFLFSGQGAQYPNMMRDLYEQAPTFRSYVDRCAELLKPQLGRDLREIIFDTSDTGTMYRAPTDEGSDSSFVVRPSSELLDQTQYAQPALFVIEYALAQLWLSWGVRPDVLIGHSIGEYVAACLAGVLSLADALALVAARGRMMQALPPGAMLSVPRSEQELQAYLRPDLALAATNGPDQCVIAGPVQAIERLEAELARQGVEGRRLHTSHAFHSPMIDPIITLFTERVRSIALRAPEIPYISNVTGTWITPEAATDPAYWGQHLRHCVRFTEGIGVLLQTPDRIFLEVGPGQALSALVKRHPERVSGQLVLASARRATEQQPDLAFALSTLGRLWLAGVPIDWPAVYAAQRRQRLPLPTYPFERQRYWVESPAPASTGQPPADATPTKRDLADWFSAPSWKRSVPPLRKAAGAPVAQPAAWLVLIDACGVGSQIVQRLKAAGCKVTAVRAGQRYAKLSDELYELDPARPADYATLVRELRAQRQKLDCIAHLWAINAPDPAPVTTERLERAQSLGLYSLLFLVQALEQQQAGAPVQLAVVSSNLQPVTGDEILAPEKATLGGLCKVIPQEYPHIICRSIDLLLPEANTPQQEQLIDQLVGELDADMLDPVVAYRGRHRWVQTVEAIRLTASAGQPRLRQGGVYVITGGLGGIGLALAEHLARTLRAKLVLISRSGLPPRDTWPDWLATHEQHDLIGQRIRAIRSCEELGAEVLVFGADVANREQMQATIAEVYARFGTLHGVIHAAGLIDRRLFHPIQEVGPDDCAQQFQAKVTGTLVLAELLRDRPIDFCMLMSSLSAILGGRGFAVYAAANLFMDSLAHTLNQSGPTPWIAVDWDGWEITVDQELHGRAAAQLAITLAEGMDAFERIIAQLALPQVIVSTSAIQARIDRWITLAPHHDASAAAVPDKALHPRPSLPHAYAAPRNATEQTIADICQQLLGVEPIGASDSFFELGGDSLFKLQLTARLRQAFTTEFKMRDLLEADTVEAVALVILQAIAQQHAPESLERMLAMLEQLSAADVQRLLD
jgi:acyl transferase domain-containing protein/acyl carrier protein